MLKKLQKAD